MLLQCTILDPEPVTEEACEAITASGSFQDETGEVHPVYGDHLEIRYKYLATGSMTYSSINVYCQGGSLKVNGEDHTSVVEMRTVSLDINTIHVAFRSDGKIQDLES